MRHKRPATAASGDERSREAKEGQGNEEKRTFRVRLQPSFQLMGDVSTTRSPVSLLYLNSLKITWAMRRRVRTSEIPVRIRIRTWLSKNGFLLKVKE